MNPLLVGLGVLVTIVTFVIVKRLSRNRKRYHRAPQTSSYHHGHSHGIGSRTCSSPVRSAPEPASYDTGLVHYSFTRPDDDDASHHSSHHLTSEAPASYGDIGSVDSSSSGGDSGGCGGGD
jgi:hypothetical protein